MKVVLFCGGQGMRLRDAAENVPKPMLEIGYRPILWHVMKYYAHFGHKDFILCLGYRADVIKDYFLNYDECVSNDFVITNGGGSVELLGSDISDWRITFVYTGLNASVGERLYAVRKHLEGEDVFMANYTDGVTDLHLPDMLSYFEQHDKTACFLSVRPNVSFHSVTLGSDGTVTEIEKAAQSALRINGGFFILRQRIFDYMRPGEDLVGAPFHRLVEDGELLGYPFDRFWACMDTFKEKQMLEDIYNREDAPWEVWKDTAEPATGDGAHLPASQEENRRAG